MSLINDALKKAQRLRTEDATGTMPPMPGGDGVRVTKRSQPRTSQQLVVLAAAALVVVVLTVVATVWLINRPAAPKPAPPAAVAPVQPKSAADTPTPIIIAPMIRPAPVAETPPPKAGENPKPADTSPPPIVAPRIENVAITPTPPASTPPPPAPAPKPGASETHPVLLAAAPPAVAAAAPPAEPKDDERVHAFVDAIRVTGIRSSGDDSRVLMNDRVFRVNDIVDRGLGVRLTKVNTNSLVFTDANGATYVKNF